MGAKEYKRGSVFGIEGEGEEYALCQADYGVFVLIGLIGGNRYTKGLSPVENRLTHDFVEKLADGAAVKLVRETIVPEVQE